MLEVFTCVYEKLKNSFHLWFESMSPLWTAISSLCVSCLHLNQLHDYEHVFVRPHPHVPGLTN